MKGTFIFDSGEIINLDSIIEIGTVHKHTRTIRKNTKLVTPFFGITFFGVREEHSYETETVDVFNVQFNCPAPYPAIYFAHQRDALVKAFEEYKTKQ